MVRPDTPSSRKIVFSRKNFFLGSKCYQVRSICKTESNALWSLEWDGDPGYILSVGHSFSPLIPFPPFIFQFIIACLLFCARHLPSRSFQCTGRNRKESIIKQIKKNEMVRNAIMQTGNSDKK